MILLHLTKNYFINKFPKQKFLISKIFNIIEVIHLIHFLFY